MARAKRPVGTKPDTKKDNAKFSSKETDWDKGISVYAKDYIKLITRDLNNNLQQANKFLTKYTKDDIAKYLSDPKTHEKNLRNAVIYVYGASSHFRRLIQYFVGLSDLSYIVEPYKIDTQTANERTMRIQYRKTLKALSSMNIKTQLPKILTVCLREDVFYATLWTSNDSIIIQQLPSDYCQITTIEGNVPNVTFDFSYFGAGQNVRYLEFYPPEFKTKYEIYKKEGTKSRWMELDSPNSFAIKCNSDILDYAIPPFAGILREIYEIEDYKGLKLAKTALENYAMLWMKLPMDDEGRWILDYDKAKSFWRNLDSVLPEEVGSVLSPMDIEKISFDHSNTGDIDTIGESEQALYTAAGVSSLLFNNSKASANALLLSIKADQAITYGIVKSIGDALNRFIQMQPYGKNFIVNFLDVSPFNRAEVGDAYLKAASYGLPTISAYAASQGIGQAELDSMSFLENKVLDLHSLFQPLRNSAQMSGGADEGEGATEEGGAPPKPATALTDSGEQSREDGDDW